jgi:hypothetical protein
MGYCRFELTLKDLRDCYNNMDSNLSNKEHEYRLQLLELCNSISEEYSNYDFDEIQNEEEDN